MNKKYSICNAIILLLFPMVSFAGEVQIDARCASALEVVLSGMPGKLSQGASPHFSRYAAISCDDREEYLAIEMRKSNHADPSSVRDGADYFLVDTARWVVVEKNIGSNSWLDPEYERKMNTKPSGN